MEDKISKIDLLYVRIVPTRRRKYVSGSARKAKRNCSYEDWRGRERNEIGLKIIDSPAIPERILHELSLLPLPYRFSMWSFFAPEDKITLGSTSAASLAWPSASCSSASSALKKKKRVNVRVRRTGRRIEGGRIEGGRERAPRAAATSQSALPD